MNKWIKFLYGHAINSIDIPAMTLYHATEQLCDSLRNAGIKFIEISEEEVNQFKNSIKEEQKKIVTEVKKIETSVKSEINKIF